MTNPYEYKGESDPDEPNYWLDDFFIFAKTSFYALITTFVVYLFMKICPRKIPTSPSFDFVYTIFTFFSCILLFMWNEYDEASKSKQKTRKDL